MKKLILRCSGANFQTLMRSEVAADRERYIGYGLLVILSAVFCFICTFYLIFCFEKSIIIALLMSCVITGIKFTLDFLIVPTMPLLESSWTLVLILKTLFRLSMALILSIFPVFCP